MKNRPILGITMGDICGIGPEITAKVLQKKYIYEACRPIVVGSARMMECGIKVAGAQGLEVNTVHRIADAKFEYGTIDVYDVPLIHDVETPPYGTVCAAGGSSAFTAVAKVIELAMNNEIDGTITGPLNKESMNLAGHHYSGHTEIYADLTGTEDYAMMLADEELRVVHVSTHVSLREACERVKKDRVHKVIHIANEACKSLGVKAPRIAVAGLNPHAGENGMFGTEEIEEIEPAIQMAQAEGLDVDGPVAPDTVFSKARGGMYDIVVAMYHDQGHIPLKVIGFVYDEQQQKWKSVTGVNITLGLPIIRVSVDHGTAFGKSGKGTASEASLENAVQYGVRIANAKLQKG